MRMHCSACSTPLLVPTRRRGRQHYQVEPYVVAADISAQASRLGGGGWTWYTGSAAWMYRLGLERILGLRRMGKALQFDPCIPPGWPAYRIEYRFGSTTYRIEVRNPDGWRAGVQLGRPRRCARPRRPRPAGR